MRILSFSSEEIVYFLFDLLRQTCFQDFAFFTNLYLLQFIFFSRMKYTTLGRSLLCDPKLREDASHPSVDSPWAFMFFQPAHDQSVGQKWPKGEKWKDMEEKMTSFVVYSFLPNLLSGIRNSINSRGKHSCLLSGMFCEMVWVEKSAFVCVCVCENF